MELTEAQKDEEKNIRIIMSEEFIGTPECEYAYIQITSLIEEYNLQEHDKYELNEFENRLLTIESKQKKRPRNI
jgi:hypothetical protein